MDEPQKQIAQEWKDHLKQSEKRNRKKLMEPMVRALRNFLIADGILIICFIAVLIVVLTQGGETETIVSMTQFLVIAIAVIVGAPATYRYLKDSSALIRTERLKFFLLKWTGDQNEKLGELAVKYEADETAVAALQEFKNWMEEEVAKMMES